MTSLKKWHNRKEGVLIRCELRASLTLEFSFRTNRWLQHPSDVSYTRMRKHTEEKYVCLSDIYIWVLDANTGSVLSLKTDTHVCVKRSGHVHACSWNSPVPTWELQDPFRHGGTSVCLCNKCMLLIHQNSLTTSQHSVTKSWVSLMVQIWNLWESLLECSRK